MRIIEALLLPLLPFICFLCFFFFVFLTHFTQHCELDFNLQSGTHGTCQRESSAALELERERERRDEESTSHITDALVYFIRFFSCQSQEVESTKNQINKSRGQSLIWGILFEKEMSNRGIFFTVL